MLYCWQAQLSPQTKTHLFRQIKVQGAVIMTHEAIQEANPKSWDGSVPPSAETTFLPESEFVALAIESTIHHAKIVDPGHPDFIGPRDASDSARQLMLIRAKDLGRMAVGVNLFPHEYDRLVKDVTVAVSTGNLRLRDDYPLLSTDESITRFITESTGIAGDLESMSLPHATFAGPDVIDQLNLERDEKIQKLEHANTEAQFKILRLRQLAVDRGASEEELHEFDTIAKIRTAIQAEDDESMEPKTWTGKFWHVISAVGRFGLGVVNILPPKTDQHETVDSQKIAA